MNQNNILQSRREISIASKATKTVIVSIVLTLLSNTFLSGGLFSESLNSIIKFQSSATPASVLFFNIISFLANTIFVVIVIGILFMTHPVRIKVLVFLSFFILNTYFMTILKAAYHEARPFWYSKSIKQLEWTCPRQYGNPSGHSWLVVVLYEPLLNDFLYTNQRTGKIIRWIFLVVIFILVPFSRMYLGAHSGNQVFFGLLMGVSMVTLYRFCVQRLLYRKFEYLIKCSQENAKKIKTILLILLIQAVFVIVPMVIYINAPTQDFQYILILNQKCPDRITTSIGLNGGILFTSMLISFLFGLIYGLINCSQQTFLYIYGRWKYSLYRSTIKQRVLKVLVELGLICLPLVLVLILKEIVNGVVLKYYLFSGIITLSGYLFITYSERVLIYLKVIRIYSKKGDLL